MRLPPSEMMGLLWHGAPPSQEAQAPPVHGKKLAQYLLQEVRSRVVFEPVAGPGEYELYVGCAPDAEGAPPDDAFLAIASTPAAERLPPVHITREERPEASLALTLALAQKLPYP